jgi:helix-turn-helix, Psq domain
MDLNIRIEQAIDAIKNKKIASVRQASQLYDIPRTTLRRRIIEKQQTKYDPRFKLTPTKETVVVK